MTGKNSEGEREPKDSQRIRSEASLREIRHVLWPSLSIAGEGVARTYQIRLQRHSDTNANLLAVHNARDN